MLWPNMKLMTHPSSWLSTDKDLLPYLFIYFLLSPTYHYLTIFFSYRMLFPRENLETGLHRHLPFQKVEKKLIHVQIINSSKNCYCFSNSCEHPMNRCFPYEDTFEQSESCAWIRKVTTNFCYFCWDYLCSLTFLML